MFLIISMVSKSSMAFKLAEEKGKYWALEQIMSLQKAWKVQIFILYHNNVTNWEFENVKNFYYFCQLFCHWICFYFFTFQLSICLKVTIFLYVITASMLKKDLNPKLIKSLCTDKDKALQFIAHIKWEHGYVCRKCGHTNYCSGKTVASRRCTRCKKEESATANTIIHNCKFSINKAFYIVYTVCL